MLLRHPVFSNLSVVLPHRCLLRRSPISIDRGTGKVNYRQTRGMLDDLRCIDASLSDNSSLKRDLPWGFSIYRCSYKNESAWSRLLEQLREDIKSNLECNRRLDLLSRHQLVVNDDVEKFNGATSHDIRDHFNTWVTDQLPQIASSPEALERILSDDKHGMGPQYFLGPRYNFCLFVDDFCLESLGLFEDSLLGPIVKILPKPRGDLTAQEREYKTHPEWHDGQTDDELEMVGWMYTPIHSYVQWYDLLEEPSNWEAFYLRPRSQSYAVF